MQTLSELLKNNFKNSLLGTYGVEIETENTYHLLGYKDELLKAGWDVCEDGSLIDGIELVLSSPLSKKAAINAISTLPSIFNLASVTPSYSIRTSVHVHMNMARLTVDQMFCLIFLYWIFEDDLSKLCGSTRQGNLFCLRRSDAEGAEEAIYNAIKAKNLYKLFRNDLKYSALNFMPLIKYCSLEFRMMKGTHSARKLKLWIDSLDALRAKAMEIGTPTALPFLVSMWGEEGVTKEVFGERLAKHIKSTRVAKNLKELRYLLYEYEPGANWVVL